MSEIVKTYRVPNEWMQRNGRRLFFATSTVGRYKRGTRFLEGVGGTRHDDDTWTVQVKLTQRPNVYVGLDTPAGMGWRAVTLYPRGDIRKVLKMLTVAERKLTESAPPPA